MKICGTTSDDHVPAGDENIQTQMRHRTEAEQVGNKGKKKRQPFFFLILVFLSLLLFLFLRLCQRGLTCSENHLENLTLLHAYLKLHQAKQNDAGERERLIGSGLVSAAFVGSLQETPKHTPNSSLPSPILLRRASAGWGNAALAPVKASPASCWPKVKNQKAF